MRTTLAVVCIIGFASVAMLIGNLAPSADASTGPIPLKCDRACMENVVNQYLAALVAHDPKRLPLSKDVIYTENAQRIDLGDGFWKTVEGRGDYTQIFADPEFGQAAFMGTMREAGALLLMSLRLRIELGRITEIESVYFRPAGRRRTEQHRRYGQVQTGGYLVQIDSFSAMVSFPPGVDICRRRLLHRAAEK
jgi:hypothetical protein